jgi:hypothetical protein
MVGGCKSPQNLISAIKINEVGGQLRGGAGRELRYRDRAFVQKIYDRIV